MRTAPLHPLTVGGGALSPSPSPAESLRTLLWPAVRDPFQQHSVSRGVWGTCPLSRPGGEGQLGPLPAVGPWPCWSPAFSRKACVGTPTLSVKGLQPRPSTPTLPRDPDMSPTVTGLPSTASGLLSLSVASTKGSVLCSPQLPYGFFWVPFTSRPAPGPGEHCT